MKLFRDLKGEVFGFEDDGSQDYLITSGMVPYSLPVLPPPIPAEIQAALDAEVTRWIDDQARLAGYKDAAYMASYYNSTNAEHAAEAQAFVAWRDGIWQQCLAILAAVQAGTRPVPTAAALLSELPPFEE